MRTTSVTLVSFIGNSLSSGHLDGVSSCFRKCRVHSRLALMLMLVVISALDACSSCCTLNLHTVRGGVQTIIYNGGKGCEESR